MFVLFGGLWRIPQATGRYLFGDISTPAGQLISKPRADRQRLLCVKRNQDPRR